MFADISRVTADCSSTAVEIAIATSFSRTLVAWIALIAPTASRVASCVPDHPDRFAAAAEDRVVGQLKPDLTAVLADALELPRLESAAPQRRPELLIGRAVAIGRIDELGMRLAADFVDRISERVTEILVGRQDLAIKVELDGGLGTIQSRQFGCQASIEHKGHLNASPFDGAASFDKGAGSAQARLPYFSSMECNIPF